MGIKKIFAAGCVVAGCALLAVSCGNKKKINDPFVDFPDDEDLAGVVTIVTEPVTKDTVFNLEGRDVPTLQIARIFPTEYSDVYFSIRVFALNDTSTVNSGLAQIISEDFSSVAGGDLHYDLQERTSKAVTDQIDYYGKVFNDTILPELRESVVNGFYVNVDLRPVWVSEDGDIFTYASYQESCTGGAPAEIDCYYVSFSQSKERRLTFDDLVPSADQPKVRQQLLSEMAKQAGKTEKAYLEWLTDYLNPETDRPFTASDFPIYAVAIYNGHLVFSYPQGTVAPVAEGCPIFKINYTSGN